jgi:hypothetical protein
MKILRSDSTSDRAAAADKWLPRRASAAPAETDRNFRLVKFLSRLLLT